LLSSCGKIKKTKKSERVLKHKTTLLLSSGRRHLKIGFGITHPGDSWQQAASVWVFFNFNDV